MPPECLHEPTMDFKYTPKVDSFSFGIFVFELVTGLSPCDPLEEEKTMRDVMLEKSHLEDDWIDQLQSSNLQERFGFLLKVEIH